MVRTADLVSVGVWGSVQVALVWAKEQITSLRNDRCSAACPAQALVWFWLQFRGGPGWFWLSGRVLVFACLGKSFDGKFDRAFFILNKLDMEF